MNKILIVSNSKRNKKEQNLLDKFGDRISRNVWALSIHEKYFKKLIKKLKSISSKNTDLLFIKDGKTILRIGTNEKNSVSKHKLKTSFYRVIAKYHDLGKKSVIFQNLVQSKENSLHEYFIRHEYLSILYIEFFIQHKMLIEYNSVKYHLETEDFLIYLESRLNYKDFTIVDENNIFYDLIYSIGTHHKLPKLEDGILSNSVYINKNREINIEKANITLTQYEKGILYSDLQSIKNIKTKTIEDIISLRTKTLLADANGSALQVNKMKKDENKESYYKRIEDKYNASEFKAKSKGEDFQTYKEHVNAVSLYMDKFNKFLNKECILSNWFSDYKDFIFEQTEDNRFIWQERCINFVKENIDINLPTLTFLTSSTGSGKTRFGTKLHLLLSKDKRLTILNGLRNLTLQTGTAYKNLDIFNEDEINVLIGSKPIENIYDSDSNDIEPIVTDWSSLKNKELLNYFNSRYFNKNKESFLDTPILIATLDFLHEATNFNRQSHVLPLLRLMSSDIFIDEIDNLGLESQNALLNLIFLIGLLRKNLTISTATLYPEFAKKIKLAYENGLEYSGEKRANFLYLSDFINFKINNNEDFNKVSERNLFVLKNKIEIKDIGFDNLLRTAVELHDNEHEVDSFGIEYSAGLIRIANIKNIKKSILKMVEDSKDYDDINFEFIVYHSQMILLERSFLEKELDKFLTRKSGKLYDKYTFKNKRKKNIIIVIASPVEEVGRDHDFDWGIIEPSSLASIIQSIGRIFRHRDERCRFSDKTNVYIMNKNFRAQNNEEIVFTKPGLENSSVKFLVNGSNELKELVNDREVNYLQTNKHINNEERNYLAKFEKKVLEQDINFNIFKGNKKDDIKNILSQEFYKELRTMTKKLSGYFNKENKFYSKLHDNKEYDTKLNVEYDHSLEECVNVFFNSNDFEEFKNKFLKENKDYELYNSFELPMYSNNIKQVNILKNVLIEIEYF